MPRLANERNDLYARHRAKGMAPSKAAIAAGYATGSSTTHLENDPEIVTRISEYIDQFKSEREAQRAAAVEAAKVVGSMTGVGRSWVIQQLAEVASLAKQDQDYAQANRALELIGKDFGMFAGGSDGDGESTVPRTLDLDALANMLDKAHDALPAPAADPLRTFDDSVALGLIEGQTQVRTVTAAPAATAETPEGEAREAQPDADPEEIDPEEADQFADIRAQFEADES
jgi:hypothetical protein